MTGPASPGRSARDGSASWRGAAPARRRRAGVGRQLRRRSGRTRPRLCAHRRTSRTGDRRGQRWTVRLQRRWRLDVVPDSRRRSPLVPPAQWQINAPSGLTITGASDVQHRDLRARAAGTAGTPATSGTGAAPSGAPHRVLSQTGADRDQQQLLRLQALLLLSSCPGITRDYDASQRPPIDLTVEENQGPGLIAVGSNNLWYQAGHDVWNPAGDPWSIELRSERPVRRVRHVRPCRRH